MLPFFQENLPIFTGKFYIFRRKTHDFLSKLKNQGIDKISIPEKSIDTHRYFPVVISNDNYQYFSHHYIKQRYCLIFVLFRLQVVWKGTPQFFKFHQNFTTVRNMLCNENYYF